MATRTVLAMLLFAAGAATAQSRIVGSVKNGAGEPIQFAHVMEASERVGAVSDSAGRFELSLDRAGDVQLRILRIGFHPQDIKLRLQRDSIARLDIVMDPAPTTLEAVRVVETMVDKLALTGFYDRLRQRKKGTNSGYFVTPEELDQRRPVTVGDVLGSAPSLQLVGGSDGAQRVMNSGRTCIYTIYLDGIRQELLKNGSGASRAFGSRSGGMGMSDATDVNALIRGSDLAAVEIYARVTSAPPQFQMLNGACGIIALWSKR